MLNPHFVAGEHGLFGAHESEDILTIFLFETWLYFLQYFTTVFSESKVYFLFHH